MIPKISVIIPVYNAGTRLDDCVQSLVNQSIDSIELIFVLDCPSDGSDAIIEKYASLYNNIVYIKNETNINIGLSRNKGLSIARGKYVAFCDHDDVVDIHMYENMVNVADRENADIILGVPEYVYQSDPSLNTRYYYPEDTYDIRNQLLSLLIGNDNDDPKWSFYFSHGVIWDNIYKREILLTNNIGFVDNNKTTFEDNLFLIKCLIASRKVVVYNHLVYYHYITNDNTSSKAQYTKSKLIISYIEYLYSILNSNMIFNKYKTRYYNSVVMYITGAFVKEIKTNIGSPYNVLKALQLFRSNCIIKDSFKNCTIRPTSNRILQKISLNIVHFILKF